MDLKELAKMTVVKLREEAHKFEDIKGTHGMTKEQLIDVLCDKLNIPKKKAVPEGIGRRALKRKILDLAAKRDEVLAAGDRGKTRVYRRRLKSMRRKLRKVIHRAEHVAASAPAAPKEAAPSS